jgi:hypothetical protein
MQKNKATIKRRNGATSGFTHPPQFAPTIVVKKKFRFQAVASAAADAVLYRSIGDLLMVAATAVTGFQLGNFIRLRKVEVWGPMAATLVPVTVSVEWPGATAGVYGKSVIHSDTSMGASEPAHVVSKPPAGSQSAMWLSSQSGGTAFTLAYPANAIVDLTYELVLRDDGTASAVVTAPVGATPGALYVRALNSNTNANLPPLSFATA